MKCLRLFLSTSLKMGVLFFFPLLLLNPVYGRSGLTSTFAKVKIENLQPGHAYRISKLYKPIIVTNASDDPITLKMVLLLPHEVELDPGFLPIPDVTWASIDKDQHRVEAWDDAISDLRLAIPPDKKHWGKKYQLHIWSRAEGAGNIAVALIHKLMFTIAEEPDPNADDKPQEVLQFDLEPFQIFADKPKFGRPINIGDLSETPLVLKNTSDVTCRYRIETIRFETAPIINLKVWEPGPNRDWLNLGEREFEIEPKQEKKIPMTINIPRSRSFRRKKYIFLIRATVLNGDIPFSRISRVYLTTGERILD